MLTRDPGRLAGPAELVGCLAGVVAEGLLRHPGQQEGVPVAADAQRTGVSVQRLTRI